MILQVGRPKDFPRPWIRTRRPSRSRPARHWLRTFFLFNGLVFLSLPLGFGLTGLGSRVQALWRGGGLQSVGPNIGFGILVNDFPLWSFCLHLYIYTHTYNTYIHTYIRTSTALMSTQKPLSKALQNLYQSLHKASQTFMNSDLNAFSKSKTLSLKTPDTPGP